MRIGFSTGSFFFQDVSILEATQRIAQIETEAVEINFGKPSELLELGDGELEKIHKATEAFQHVSIHAPFRDVYYSSQDKKLLKALRTFARKTKARYIVFHPDTIQDAPFLESILGPFIAIENMDNRKNFGQGIADLSKVFEQMPSARFLLDLNHVYTVDKSMKLAQELASHFSARLTGYHISGYGNENILHTLLHQTKEMEILSAIPNQSLTAIHEGTISSHEDFIKEYRFLREYFSSIE